MINKDSHGSFITWYKKILILIFGGLLITILYHISEFTVIPEISSHYINHGVEETGAVNLVTGILFDYRAFDTLGEATVILSAAAALAFLLPKRRTPLLQSEFTIIVYQIISLILPVMAIMGVYLIIFGHLSPGGGFTGGVVLATIPILLTITYGISYTEQKVPPSYKSLVENVGALMFLIAGFMGILRGSTFLASGRSGISLGEAGTLISAGIIPHLNIIVGLKVGAGLSTIFNSLIKEE